MSDPLVPPPRRPAPDHLRERVQAELHQAPRHRVRPRQLVLPAVAAAAAAAVVFSVTGLGGQSTIEPAQTASPAPTTSSASDPTPSADPTRAPIDLDVRRMSKTEIAADTKSCRDVDKDFPNPVPKRGKIRTVFAEVQHAGGLAGPSSKVVRVLIIRDDAGAWVCEDGINTSWSTDGIQAPTPSKATPAVEVPNYGGGASADCGGADQRSAGTTLYFVGEQVAEGQMRMVKGKTKGPWLTARPHDGLVHFVFAVQGEDASARDVSVQFRFPDTTGEPVTIQPYGGTGTKTVKTAEVDLLTCAEVPDRPTPRGLLLPKNDKAGVSTCLSMAKESADESGTTFGSGWSAKLIVSTDREWGAVLGNGRERFGCSLFPTNEISRVSSDTTAVDQEAFAFAMNPIERPEGQSIWAAGHVPTDVTAIRYRLPGQHTVNAKITDDGYWMLKYHQQGLIGETTDVKTWDPVVVTVTRPSGNQTFTLPFTDKTMCNQVTHGC